MATARLCKVGGKKISQERTLTEGGLGFLSFRFVSFRSFRFVPFSFRLLWVRFVSVRVFPFRFVSCFVSCSFAVGSFRFVSFTFRFKATAF